MVPGHGTPRHPHRLGISLTWLQLFPLAAPELDEAVHVVAGDFQRGGVVIGVEGDPLGLAQVLVQIELDLMVRVVDQPEEGDGAGDRAEIFFHALLRSEGELALMQLVLQAVDVHLLVALEDDQIVPVALVVSEKQVLAVCRVEILPVFHRLLYRRKRRMLVHDVTDAQFLQLVKYFSASFLGCLHMHLS